MRDVDKGSMAITRREFTGSIAAATAIAAVPGGLRRALAEEPAWRHGLSLFGELKYAPGFPHFDYVNPDAPKGGRLRRATIGTFDTLNPFTVKGSPAGLLGVMYDTLMTTSYDEPASEYGLLVDAVQKPDDFSWVKFRMRPEARWHDGQPVTVDDVIWSLDTLRASHPQYNFYYANIVAAEQTGEHEVMFTFDQVGNRELPQITGQLIVLPKHYWEDEGRDFATTTLDPPLGSGPYRIGAVDAGRRITFERVDDYWARDLPVNVGKDNFGQLVVEYYRDFTVLLEAFKADEFDLRLENGAKRWATGYDFPARERGDVVLETFRTRQAESMQGFAFNLRREKYQDPRVRLAFNHAFDFEWLNENIFFGQYQRTQSYFQNSELAATGLPEGRELELLEEVRDQVPAEVFTTEFQNPVGGSTSATRRNLRAARALLEEAGWTIRDGTLTNADGAPFEAEFLIVQPDSERVINPYLRNLERLGIRGSIRVVDVSQYRNRLDNFDFDITTTQFPQSLSPGNEQRDFFGSEAADAAGSRNVVGIKNPAVDQLIDTIIFAESREELVAACRALDRILLWNHYLVPQFFTPDIRVARWNRFSFPDVQPDYVFSTQHWWFDEAKAGSIRQDS